MAQFWRLDNSSAAMNTARPLTTGSPLLIWTLVQLIPKFRQVEPPIRRAVRRSGTKS